MSSIRTGRAAARGARRDPGGGAVRRRARARAGGAGRHRQARGDRRDRNDQVRSRDPGRQRGADPRSARGEAPAQFRFHADDGARHGQELAERDARAAEARHGRVPRAPRAHVFRRAQQLSQRDDRLQAAADEPRRHRGHRADAGACGPPARRSRSTTAWRRRRTAGSAYDVIVGGVSLVTNYRDEFNDQIKAGGVDGLIKTLADRNKGVAAK